MTIDEKRMEKMFKTGKSYSEIAEAFGCSKVTVWNHKRNLGLVRKEKAESKTDAERAREMRRNGMKLRQIAAKLGCSVTKAYWLSHGYEHMPTRKKASKKRRAGRIKIAFKEPLTVSKIGLSEAAAVKSVSIKTAPVERPIEFTTCQKCGSALIVKKSKELGRCVGCRGSC